MASGDTRTQQYLDIAANGTRADLPSDTCCETRTQTLIRGVAERIMDVEDEVERLENNPDVADIVATYADLQAYPTSQLTDKDVVRVLQDETRDGDSTYYRWSTTAQTWTYIGESKQYEDFVGTDGTTAGTAGLVPAPATTDAGKFLKADGTWDDAGSTYTAGDGIDITNDVVSATNTGKARELTAEDYDYPADNPTSVALWELPAGIYHAASGVVLRTSLSSPDNAGGTYIIGKDANGNSQILRLRGTNLSGARYYITGTQGADTVTNKAVFHEVFDSLTSTSTTEALSANQGKVLKDLIDALDARVTALEGN